MVGRGRQGRPGDVVLMFGQPVENGQVRSVPFQERENGLVEKIGSRGHRPDRRPVGGQGEAPAGAVRNDVDVRRNPGRLAVGEDERLPVGGVREKDAAEVDDVGVEVIENGLLRPGELLDDVVDVDRAAGHARGIP